MRIFKSKELTQNGKEIKMNINVNGNLIDLIHSKSDGILNVTPNSFYDGGKHKEINSIIHQVDKMLSEGADLLILEHIRVSQVPSLFRKMKKLIVWFLL